MNPTLKKVMAAVAVKQVVDRIQEARAPRQGFIRRNLGKLILGALVGGGLYAYKTGKVEQLIGGGSPGYRGDSYPAGPGTEPISQPQSSGTTGDRTLETTSV
jgi:hypothetical protein